MICLLRWCTTWRSTELTMAGHPQARFISGFFFLTAGLIPIHVECVRLACRQVHPEGAAKLRFLFEDFALDSDRRELRRRADLVALAPQVFNLLHYLIQNRERFVSKDDLIAGVWDGRIVSESALTTRINAARSAIGDNGEKQRLIKTVPRKGFRFVGRVQEEQGPGSTLDGETPVEPPRPALALPDKPSIAVLAFTNMSGDPGQDYFSDGITEDIITDLSRFSELFVIARNSSFQYKGKSPDIRQVGRALGVRYVLEGSIRRVGDRVRITSSSMPLPARTAGESVTTAS